LFLVACGGSQDNEDELAQQEEHFRSLLEEQRLDFEELLAQQELEVYELQSQVGQLQQGMNRLNSELSTENQALRNELYRVTGSDELFHYDAGRWHWRVWAEWEGGLSLDDFTIRIYSHPGAWYDFETYIEIEVLAQDWAAQVIDAMREHAQGIRIADMWFEETRLVVDLEHAEGILFNWGSSGGYFRTRSLIDSLATIPNVTEVIVLVGGVRGLSADHFNFAEIFRVEDGQWERRN